MKKLITLFSLLIFMGCNNDDSDNPNPSNPTGKVPLSGQSYLMEFFQADSSAPYTQGQVLGFNFPSNGNLQIDENPDAMDGYEHDLSYSGQVGNEYSWEDNNRGYRFLLSLKNDNSLNEVNLFNLTSNSFLGQFTEVDTTTSNELDLIKGFSGTYSVSNVSKGSHSRLTVLIDADGNIDFDAGVQLANQDYALISDQRVCCNGIWVDLLPYPTETYPRVELYVDAQGDLISMTYYPQYSSISGRVEVEF